MANYLEALSGVLQNLGAAGIALLVVPVLITVWARDVTRALYTSLLSLASFMLFVAPASAVSALAILSGLASFVVALGNIGSRSRREALNKELVDLESRMDGLETAEQRRSKKERKRRQAKPVSTDTDPPVERSTHMGPAAPS